MFFSAVEFRFFVSPAQKSGGPIGGAPRTSAHRPTHKPMQRATPSLLAAAARHFASAAAPAPLFAVTLLERLPVVAPDPPAWAATAAVAAADRAAASRRQLPDLAPASDDGRAAAAGGGWAPAPRTTAADAAGDRTSLNRALDRRLFMIVRGNDENITALFPSTRADADEPMRAAAERALAAVVTGCDAYFVGNAPAGHAAGAGPGGGSLFFHRAQLVGAGAPAPADPTAKLEWLTLDELVAAVGGEEGEGSVGRLLRRML